MKILDPSCGSGIFLVLVYKRLVELELATKNSAKLAPEELRGLLVESIFGVEREADACNVAELSLILTLLNYIEPPELHKNSDFKFPRLRDGNIFNADFFDDTSTFWESGKFFDWIVVIHPGSKSGKTI
jgi:type I restriction-modification system DNA methylase subunit